MCILRPKTTLYFFDNDFNDWAKNQEKILKNFRVIKTELIKESEGEFKLLTTYEYESDE